MKFLQHRVLTMSRTNTRIMLAVCLGIASSSLAAADYQITDLGANVSPNDINNYGVIAGTMDTDQYPSKAFYGVPGALVSIDVTSANAINDNDIVVGRTLTGAFVLDGNRLSQWDEHAAFGIN